MGLPLPPCVPCVPFRLCAAEEGRFFASSLFAASRAGGRRAAAADDAFFEDPPRRAPEALAPEDDLARAPRDPLRADPLRADPDPREGLGSSEASSWWVER